MTKPRAFGVKDIPASFVPLILLETRASMLVKFSMFLQRLWSSYNILTCKYLHSLFFEA